MKRPVGISAGLLVSCLLLPTLTHADYSYPGSAAAQPLAVIEPQTEATLFHTYRPRDPSSPWSVGLGLDAYRIRDDTEDQDIIVTLTGSWSPGPGWLAGLSLPYIVRDPDFNESDLLDMRLFIRSLLAGDGTGFSLAGEVTCILPTAGTGDAYPFTLDSTVPGIRFSAAGASGPTTFGLNLGYQSYLQTEGDSDSDLLYGVFLQYAFSEKFSGILEFAGSSHSYEGTLGSDTVSDDYVTVGVHYRLGKGRLGASVSTGGGDSAADSRSQVSLVLPFGQPRDQAPAGPAEAKPEPAREKPQAAPAKPKAAPVPATAPARTPRVLVKITNASGIRGLGQKVSGILGEKGYTVSGLTDPSPSTQDRTVLLYPPAMTEQAIGLARTLTFSRTLMDIQLVEAGPAEGTPVLILVIGADQGE